MCPRLDFPCWWPTCEATRLKDRKRCARRFWEGDARLAHDLIDQIDDADELERIAQRVQSKLTQRMLTDAIKEKGGQRCYAKINDNNNVAITGQTAQEIKKTRGQKRDTPTRDLYQLEELVKLQFLELAEQSAIKRSKNNGDHAIVQTQARVLALFQRMNQDLQLE